jgi:prophage regulatory protein
MATIFHTADKTSASNSATAALRPSDSGPNLQVIRLALLVKKLGISRSTAYAKMKAGGAYFDPDFPTPIPLGARAVGFFAHQADQWLLTQAARSTGGGA